MVVYIDVLMALNGIIDYMLLRAAAAVTRRERSRFRTFLAAAVGAAYAALCILPGLAWIAAWPCRLLVGAGMSAIVFGVNRALLRRTLVFFAFSALFGGVVFALSFVAGDRFGFVRGAVYIDVSLPILLVSAAVVYVLLTLLGKLAAKRAEIAACTYEAEIALHSRRITLKALGDTGCLVTDPLTARPVMIAGARAVAPLLPSGMAADIEAGVDTTEIHARYGSTLPLRIVFCRGVGMSGMFAAFVPESLTLDGKPCRALIAVAPVGLDGDDGVCAVIHPQALR